MGEGYTQLPPHIITDDTGPAIKTSKHLLGFRNRPNNVGAQEWSQRLGDDDRPIRLLEVLQDGDNHARNSASGGIQRMDKHRAGLFSIGSRVGSIPDVEAPALVIGAVGSA